MTRLFDFGTRHIRVVNYSRQISLPKDWLRFHALDVGDEVLIELTEDGDLLLRPMKKSNNGGK
jgi:bifunctional DNA-binding transcriptional regulator/antitoxin component of YhaV-PrlF toxin-antitoxin module